MKCGYRGVVYDCQVISLEIREQEIIGMYRGANLYSRQIQTSLKSNDILPLLMLKYRGNAYGKSSPQYLFNSGRNNLKRENNFDSLKLFSE
ncbi:hypothetical protein Sta7437_2013 [Stanieria cyanosphaera PCC 7437]|uniref:Uncharacterized protein n=1 Tax=Stanieria cyanosphaera (strain ATCC 29371 / PCC 7437) TaxID=111780 RepID=K9XSK1_STAC7|nr:DUF4278 domain-containing protein [Stanieria cyanosphaera]AFZ35565.1 hypothetical protein Sta7437_2013 [Stanieria cyanosphaera PCC 7437]